MAETHHKDRFIGPLNALLNTAIADGNARGNRACQVDCRS